jgi:hypothetical protein
MESAFELDLLDGGLFEHQYNGKKRDPIILLRSLFFPYQSQRTPPRIRAFS